MIMFEMADPRFPRRGACQLIMLLIFFLQKRHGIENKLDREGADVLRSPLDLVMYSCVTWPRVRFAGEVQTFSCPTKVPQKRIEFQ